MSVTPPPFSPALVHSGVSFCITDAARYRKSWLSVKPVRTAESWPSGTVDVIWDNLSGRAGPLLDGIIIGLFTSFEDLRSILDTFCGEWHKVRSEEPTRARACRILIPGKDPRDAIDRLISSGRLDFRLYEPGVMQEETTVNLWRDLTEGDATDGTRKPRYVSDLAIDRGRIAWIVWQRGSGAGKVLDASGPIISQGFVHLHTHYDAQIQWDPYCTVSGWHGVTSVVIGNCRLGFAPLCGKPKGPGLPPRRRTGGYRGIRNGPAGVGSH